MIYHIADQQKWAKAKTTGLYTPAAYEKDQFIHCSTKEQVTKTADRFYSANDELLLLEIDQNMVANNLKYENLEGGEIPFPHIYKPLPISVVIRFSNMKKDSNGNFVFPVDWVENMR
jgi:uncharacterized protein (DUF952 family)